MLFRCDIYTDITSKVITPRCSNYKIGCITFKIRYSAVIYNFVFSIAQRTWRIIASTIYPPASCNTSWNVVLPFFLKYTYHYLYRLRFGVFCISESSNHCGKVLITRCASFCITVTTETLKYPKFDIITYYVSTL